MIKIKKSHYDGSYIVYDENDFEHHHTHTKHLRIARVIRNNVNMLRLPKSRNKMMIISHIRVAKDIKYINELQKILTEIKSNEKRKKKII